MAVVFPQVVVGLSWTTTLSHILGTGARWKVSSSAPTSDTIFPTFRICIPPVNGAATASQVSWPTTSFQISEQPLLVIESWDAGVVQAYDVNKPYNKHQWISIKRIKMMYHVSLLTGVSIHFPCWRLGSTLLHLRSNLQGILEIGGGMFNPNRIWLKASQNSWCGGFHNLPVPSFVLSGAINALFHQIFWFLSMSLVLHVFCLI